MKKKLTLALSLLIIFTLASCSMNSLTMTEGDAQNNGSVVTPSNGSNESENESKYPERSSEWLSQPPLIKDYLEGDPEGSPMRIVGGEFYTPKAYGIGICVDDVYGIDLTKSSITFDGRTQALVGMCAFLNEETKKKCGWWNVGHIDENGWLVGDSSLWLMNEEHQYFNELTDYTIPGCCNVKAYDFILDITIIPTKDAEPVHYKIHVYPDGWTEDEFPLSDFYAWAEETFGSEE